MNDLPTEEDLRGRVLLPYLAALGVAPSDVRLEQSFTVRLGKSVHKVNRRVAKGYADVLVRSPDGSNLFILELKRTGTKLTAADRDQAISYARLLDEIAPFVLVTNGEETQLFDTITKEPIEGTDLGARWSRWSTEGPSLSGADVELRSQALQNFVGLSSDNVASFSRAQLARSLAPLKTGSNGPIGRYVPELYVPRSSVRVAFEKFLTGTDPVFVLSGESGSGKTNELCALAEHYSLSHIVVFFAGGGLTCGLADAVADEFNWSFSTSLSAPQLVKRLAGLGRQSRKPVLLFVDALDECEVAGFESSVNALVKHIADLAIGEIRLVASVLTGDWDRFARVRANPSELALALPAEPRADGSVTGGTGRPYSLGPFTQSETNQAASNYTHSFSLPNEPKGRLRERCTSPFFLRVLAETYARSVAPLPADVDASALARAWLNKLLQSVRDGGAVDRNLVKFATHVYNQRRAASSNNDSRGVRDVELSTAGIEVDRDLVSRGLISSSADSDGRITYRFVHNFIRDYLLARRVLELDRLGDEEFGAFVPALLQDAVLCRALTWHVREASGRHKHIVQNTVRGRALAFVSEYNRLRDMLSPSLAAAVDPCTSGDVGIAYSLEGATLSATALFPIGLGTSDTVIEFDRRDMTPWGGADQVWRLGARTIWFGTPNFVDTTPEIAARDYLLSQLKDKLPAEALTETTPIPLLIETARAICRRHAKLLGLDAPPLEHHLLEWTPAASLEDIDRAIQRKFGADYFRNEWVAEQIRERTRYASFSGEIATVTHAPFVAADALAAADEAVRAGRRFAAPRTQGKKDFAALPAMIQRLMSAGLKTLPASLLPSPDLKPPWNGAPIASQYSDTRLAELLEALFAEFLSAYECVVRTNFGGYARLFRAFASWPLTIVATVERRDTRYASRSHSDEICWAFCALRSEGEKPTIHVGSHSEVFQFTGGSATMRTVLGHELPFGFTCTGLSSILDGKEFAPLSSASARAAPIRSLVLQCVTDELKRIETLPG